MQKLEALLVLLYSRLPSHSYKIDGSMLSRVKAATRMMDTWVMKLHISIRHLDGYRSYLLEGERAGLWDREISQAGEKALPEERETLNQLQTINRVVMRYMNIFNGRNNDLLMMADHEPLNHQMKVDQGMGLSKERWQLPHS